MFVSIATLHVTLHITFIKNALYRIHSVVTRLRYNDDIYGRDLWCWFKIDSIS